MKAVPWLLAAILAAVVMWGYSHPRTVTIPGPAVSTASVRDSARVSADFQRAHVDSLVVELRTAKAATIAAVLRERARRPAILGRDTVYVPAQDTAQPPPPDSCFTRDELAGIEAHHAVDSANADSSHWDAKIQTVRADSLANRLGACLADRSSVLTAYGRGFLHGSAAGAAVGLGVCAVLK